MKTRLITIALGALVMLAGCSRSEVAPDVTKFRLSAIIKIQFVAVICAIFVVNFIIHYHY